MKKILIDLYGGDLGIEPILQGAMRALKDFNNLQVVFVGDEEAVAMAVKNYDIPDSRYEIIPTTEYVSPHDSAISVLSSKENSSMVLALNALKKEESYGALLSAGNTGALLVGTIAKLGLVKGLKQPALASELLTIDGHRLCLVDCGANIDCTPKDLRRFAIMGNAFYKTICDNDNPRVGLLSVGREDTKGNALTKEAFPLLQELPINFIGNIEGSDLANGYADVIVSDGYAGNILLKNIEALGMSNLAAMKQFFAGSELENHELIRKFEEKMRKTYDLNNQGGATFLGTKKTVVKMHGCANSDTVYACILQVMRLEELNFSQAVASAMQDA